MSSYVRRFDICVIREEGEGRKKAYWPKLGTAFERDDGKISGTLDSVPTFPWDGRIFLFPVEEEAEAGREPGKIRATPDESKRYVPLDKREDKPFFNRMTYEHRVHMEDAPPREKKGICGQWAKYQHRTQDWTLVTCKKCLKDKPGGA